MLRLKRLRPGVIPRVQMKRSSPGKLRGARLTDQFSGRKRNGRMGGASRSAVKSSLDNHVTHDSPDTHLPPSEARHRRVAPEMARYLRSAA